MRVVSQAPTARLTSPSIEHALEYLALEHVASSPYTRFVYPDPERARAAHRYLYVKSECEFGPPFARVIVDRDGVVAAAALLTGAELARSRFRAAIALGRAGSFLDADVQRRITAASCTLLQPAASDLYVSRFAVADRARGRGLGLRLLSECEAVARRRGCRRVVLEVSTEHQAAISLYLRGGFREITRRRAEDAPTGRELVYLHFVKHIDSEERS